MGNVKTKALASDSQMTSAKGVEVVNHHKDTTINLSYQQKRIISYLTRQTEPKSVIEMMQDLFISDPRGHISQLRKKGYQIDCYWCKTELGRYKRYYIRKEENNA